MTERYTVRDRIGALHQLIADGVWTDEAGQVIGAEAGLMHCVDALERTREERNQVFVVGNGGSAALAAHAVTDFVNANALSASTLHEPALLTCMSNDHGYAGAYARVLSRFARPGDLLIAVSSSGCSPNILQTVEAMREVRGRVLTLSGFGEDNPLRYMGEINVWLDACDYGLVELGHGFLLHLFSDRLRQEREAQPA